MMAPGSGDDTRHVLYWRKTRLLTGTLLLMWFAGTVLTCLYPVELNRWQFLGFPLGFYFAAQGSLVLFLLIVAFYAWRMNRLDRKMRDSSGERPPQS